MKIPETHSNLALLIDELIKFKVPFKVTKDGLLMRCVFHSEKTPSLAVSLKGMYKCFGCDKSGNIKDIFEYFGITSSFTKGDELIFAKERVLDLLISKLRLEEELLPKDMKLIEFDYRGISMDLLRKFKVFTSSSYPEAICVPLYYKGKLYAIIERTLLTEKQPKYKNHLFGRYMYPFPLDNINTSSVFVVEGIFDLFAMHQAGFTNTIALFGANNFYQLRRLLSEKNIRHVILLMDGDDAGFRATEKVRAHLSKYIKTDFIFMPEGFDPGDHPDLRNYVVSQLQKKNLA